MELELEEALGRPVELRTPEDLSPYFRDEVTATARPLYAA
jgi:predicted nucleotidyltransferase